MDTENLLSVDDAARMLNISTMQAWRWIKSGKLQTTKFLDRTLISKDAIAAANAQFKKIK
jgi:excisionase family DNA binding protein